MLNYVSTTIYHTYLSQRYIIFIVNDLNTVYIYFQMNSYILYIYSTNDVH